MPIEWTAPPHSVSGVATSGTVRVLVTGFGPFPGVRKNPTGTLVHALEKHKSRLARLGIELELVVLPVVYAEIAARLETLAQTLKPDAVLHFGLAARRKTLSIETRAVNRLSLLNRDAKKAAAPQARVISGAPHVLRSTFPAPLVAAALGKAGIKSHLSINPGRYVCNQTLYLSLAIFPARSIGFIHVPRPAHRHRAEGAMRTKTKSRDRRPSLDEMTRAAVKTILVMVSALRRNASPDIRGKYRCPEAARAPAHAKG